MVFKVGDKVCANTDDFNNRGIVGVVTRIVKTRAAIATTWDSDGETDQVYVPGGKTILHVKYGKEKTELGPVKLMLFLEDKQALKVPRKSKLGSFSKKCWV